MAKYLQVSYYTLMGIKKFIDLSDFNYGEWIICDGGIPTYHVRSFGEESSNVRINFIISSKRLTIDEILKRINKEKGTNLSEQKRPSVGFIKTEELIDLNLEPLPENWLENI